MTIELALGICLAAAFACYLVYRWQLAAVPPYQEPVVEKLEPTPINPQAAWPFPVGRQP